MSRKQDTRDECFNARLRMPTNDYGGVEMTPIWPVEDTPCPARTARQTAMFFTGSWFSNAAEFA